MERYGKKFEIDHVDSSIFFRHDYDFDLRDSLSIGVGTRNVAKMAIDPPIRGVARRVYGETYGHLLLSFLVSSSFTPAVAQHHEHTNTASRASLQLKRDFMFGASVLGRVRRKNVSDRFRTEFSPFIRRPT